MFAASGSTIETTSICYNLALVDHTIDVSYFDPSNPVLLAHPVTEGGRNAAWFVCCQSVPAVLRHYKRGGFISKFVKSRYVWCGAKQTRAWQEYQVLLYLHSKLVPVPRPIAAYYKRYLFTYSAAILIERISDALPIAQQLENCPPTAVALAVKQMHDAGVWHADLNVFNILMDTNKSIYLIDFDRAKRMNVVHSKHRQNNLLRLRRSLIKVRGEIGQQWFKQFQRAYQQLPAY